MASNSITLDSPVQHGGHEYATLTMREPKVRDSLAARKSGGSDADVEVRLFSNLCEVPPEVIEGMGMRDYLKLQAAYKDFLS